MAAYSGGDVYHAFARDSGFTQDRDQQHWMEPNQMQRQRIKGLQLGIMMRYFCQERLYAPLSLD
jgi:hypothetical protein